MTKTPYVLIVEDDEWLAQQHARTLSEAGIRAESVSHALAAIDSIDTSIPDALVLDLLLAGPNAFTLLHELRSHADLASIPVILCTANTEGIASEDIVAYGVRQVLDKATMLPRDLIAAVKKVLP
jgi:two-component system NtrC family sensor kinase